VCDEEVQVRAFEAGADDYVTKPFRPRELVALIQNRGRLLTHNAPLPQVWGAAYLDARQTLRAHIANLRRTIEPVNGGRLIHTDHGVGYRLADVHPEGARRGRPPEDVIDRELVGELGSPGPGRRWRGRVRATNPFRPLAASA
jgi:hypothetical protein